MSDNSEESLEWFEEWFDSPFYHMLYNNRDYKEAEQFITNIIDFLNPSNNSYFLDVACGKGRHSLYLSKQGFKVDGFDLSPSSIDIAKEHESSQLHFYTNDIRKPLNIDRYNYAFNLFTSFGYFTNDNDNQLAINSIAKSLTENGVLVLDFLNCTKVINDIGTGFSEIKSRDSIDFSINKRIEKGFIIKDISFTNNSRDFIFQEKVKAIALNDFKSYFLAANLKIEATFGNYNLDPFDHNLSDRLIMIARKQ